MEIIATAFCRNLELLKKQQIDKKVQIKSLAYFMSFQLRCNFLPIHFIFEFIQTQIV